MSESALSDDALPIWARSSAFPEAPSGYGWVGPKGRQHPLASHQELLQCLADDRKAELVLVWSPESSRVILPEELEGASDAVFKARLQRSGEDLSRAKWLMMATSLWLVVTVLLGVKSAWQLSPDSASASECLVLVMKSLMESTAVGVGLLIFLILGFIPWYQARKRWMELDGSGENQGKVSLPLLRFETWLDLQRAPATKMVAGLIAVVAAVQVMVVDSLSAAGLVKSGYWAGEWWRLLTAPMLHGNVVHFMMNVSALFYLGKRVEVFARWPHLLLVFVFSALVGGEMSARLLEATSVGASGGLMGLLGFLLVFESLHGRLVPRSARRRLLAGVALTILIGLLGYRFIDNAAHAGGLVAGMAYALIVFPKSASFNRPLIAARDRVAGSLAALVLLAAAGVAVVQMFGA